MSAHEDGGPAFPSVVTTKRNDIGDGVPFPDVHSVGGMALRDYFAGQAMTALLVDPDRVDQSRTECARLSYAMADAMLVARKGEKS